MKTSEGSAVTPQSCDLKITAKSVLLCPVLLKSPTNFEPGRSVCITRNELNKKVLTNMHTRIKTLLAHTQVATN